MVAISIGASSFSFRKWLPVREISSADSLKGAVKPDFCWCVTTARSPDLRKLNAAIKAVACQLRFSKVSGRETFWFYSTCTSASSKDYNPKLTDNQQGIGFSINVKRGIGERKRKGKRKTPKEEHDQSKSRPTFTNK